MTASKGQRGKRSTDLTRQDVARYTSDMLTSLTGINQIKGMSLLAHLLDLANAEAKRQAGLEDDVAKEFVQPLTEPPRISRQGS